MLPDDIIDLAAHVLDLFKAEGARIATAESCTGGLIAGALTEVAGSSAVVDRGFVTYSNEAKTELLGVPVTLIAGHGAVSRQVAQAMAEGALARSRATVAVAVTGIAGPTGGSPAKPVGLVYFAVAKRGEDTMVERHVFPGGRSQVRAETVRKALDLLAAGAAP